MSELECPHCARGIYEEDLGGLEQLVAQRCAPLVEAAEFLLRLKDGPRDFAYYAQKDDAWHTLREALAAYRAAQGARRGT